MPIEQETTSQLGFGGKKTRPCSKGTAARVDGPLRLGILTLPYLDVCEAHFKRQDWKESP